MSGNLTSSLKRDFKQSLVAGACYGTAEVVLYGAPIGTIPLMLGAQSAGAELASTAAMETILPKVLPSDSMNSSYMKPLVSGAAYLAINNFTRKDFKSMTNQFIQQVGSSYLAGVLVGPGGIGLRR